jgi:hypothetical protein
MWWLYLNRFSGEFIRRATRSRRDLFSHNHTPGEGGGGGGSGGGTGGAAGGGSGDGGTSGGGQAGGGDGGAGDGGSGSAGNAGTGAAGGAGDDRLSREESRQIISQRDEAKALNRAVIEALGLDVQWETDPDHPRRRRPVVNGLERIRQAVSALDDDADNRHRRTGNWDARKAELTQQHQTQVRALQETARKRVAARDALLMKLAVDGPLTAALLNAGVYKEAVADARKLARDSVRVKLVEPDDAEAEPLVEIIPLDGDGNPMNDDATGRPIGLDVFAKKFLAARPHLRDAAFRGGPGANGHGRGTVGGGGRPPATDEQAANEAANAMFGRTAGAVV